MDSTKKKEITDYFRSNIFESLTAYTGWKVIKSSKSIGIVSKEMAERYVGIQKQYPVYFGISEQALLVQFVMLSLHSFDPDTRSYSLRKVDSQKTEDFVIENKDVLNTLYALRNKLFAHRDIDVKRGTGQYKIPSIDDLDQFFKNLIDFYNELTAMVDDSSTIFSNAEEVKHDMEYLFMNLYRGVQTEQGLEFDARFTWKDGHGKVSDITPNISK